MRIKFLLVSVLLFPIPAGAQQTGQRAPQRDAQAVAVLQRAIAAMGGAAAVGQITDAVVAGSVEPASGSSVNSGSFKWESSGSEFRYEKQSASSDLVLVSGHGHPARIRNGTATGLLSHTALANTPLHFPALVLAGVIANQGYSITLIGNTSVNGAPATKVHISFDSDLIHALVTPQDWYFDATTGIPVRVEHRLPDERRAEIYVTAAEEFGNYRIVAGVVMPYKISSYEEGQLLAVETMNSVEFNTGINPSEFDAPAGGAR